jgi:hypothetical protein
MASGRTLLLLQWLLLIILHPPCKYITSVAETVDLTQQRNASTTTTTTKETTTPSSSWIVTVTVAKLEDESSAAPSQQKSLSFLLHLICFGGFSTDLYKDTIGCCNAMHGAMLQLRQLQQQQSEWLIASEVDEKHFVSYCQQQRAVIPSPIQTQMMILEPKNIPARFSLIIINNFVQTNNHTITPEYAVDHPLNSLLSRVFVYDYQGRRSFWRKKKHYGSPFALPESLTFGANAQHDDDLDDNHESNQQQHLPGCQIESHLSETGGMHRSMQHRISCRIDSLMTTSTATEYHGQVHLVLWIPQDMWFDANDAFPNNHNTCTSHSSFYNTTCRAIVIMDQHERTESSDLDVVVMDIEDTSFESPQHVIPIQIDFSILQQWNSNTTETSVFSSDSGSVQARTRMMVLELITKLHLRYPKPICRANSASSITIEPWTRVVFPAPSIYDISLENTTVTWQDVRNAPLMATYVAAGYEDDYVWIMMTTMTCSIIGLIILLREILYTSQWM